MGNIVNRVFDSSGPEGKVRGTPQQIIEKYLILARDAQLSNDRVAAEAFQQHAEHYTRMLGEAQRELQREADQRREQQDGNGNGQPYNGNREGQREGYREQQSGGYQQNRRVRDEDSPQPETPAFQPPPPAPAPVSAPSGSADVIDLAGEEEDSGLVETPEMDTVASARVAEPVPAAPVEEAAQTSTEPKPRRSRAPRAPAAPAAPAAVVTDESGEAAKPRARRRPAARKGGTPEDKASEPSAAE